MTDVIVLGAGVAGLTCAKQLQQAGVQVLVVDRARGVGGRCATRRVQQQPVDFGCLFLHGYQPDFIAAVEEASPSTLLADWPRRVRGNGAPCQPEAFAPYERRFAFRDGITAFVKQLGHGVPVRLQTEVTQIAKQQDQLLLDCADGSQLSTSVLVLAMPVEQSQKILSGLPKNTALASVNALLQMISTDPCLTLLAGYDDGVEVPQWDIWYPDDSTALQLIAHESAKRSGSSLTLVYQARPRWSREHLQQEPQRWQEKLLSCAGELLGQWAQRPLWSQGHRWRYARVDGGSELANPLLIPYEDVSIGLAGEVYAAGGGVQAAWMSGRRLADRLLQEVLN